MKKLSLLLLSLFLLLSAAIPVTAAVCGEAVPKDEGALRDYIKDCQAKIADNQGQQKTLAAAIAYFDNQIALTTAEIARIEAQLATLEIEIQDLEVKIDSIDYSLTDLTKTFISRVQSAYKKRLTTSPVTTLFATEGVGQLLRQLKYLESSRSHDQALMLELESERLTFDEQKTLKEAKQQEIIKVQTELRVKQSALAAQKAAKNSLLLETKNSEARFQSLLAQARAEFEAIQNILAGQGVETKVKEVAANDPIANIIMGSSCNSSGAHLHFIVSENGSTHNPFSYLGGTEHDNCSGSSCGSGDGDPFNPSGSWPWPISPPVTFSQGYGSTWAVRNTWVGGIYNFHNGIDINSSSSQVRAVQAGTLYRGAYTGSGGCALRYVRVDHLDSNLDTFYLHINYI